MDWLDHSEFTHTQTEKYSWLITRKTADSTPAAVVNAEHGVSQGTANLAVATKPRKFFIHLSAYDATNNEWATESEIAHQGPFKIGTGCPNNLPGYTDNKPITESDEED